MSFDILFDIFCCYKVKLKSFLKFFKNLTENRIWKTIKSLLRFLYAFQNDVLTEMCTFYYLF